MKYKVSFMIEAENMEKATKKASAYLARSVREFDVIEEKKLKILSALKNAYRVSKSVVNDTTTYLQRKLEQERKNGENI